jgi:RNA polymerase sigma-70 factor (ECF subfamily)
MPVEVVPPDTLASEELLILLRQAIATLPPKQRVVYQLREIECLTTDEVAAATRMSADQVKANLCVARNKVREILKGYGI